MILKNFRITTQFKKKLEQQRIETGNSESAIIREALRKHFDEETHESTSDLT